MLNKVRATLNYKINQVFFLSRREFFLPENCHPYSGY
jgi:hypothetical protein